MVERGRYKLLAQTAVVVKLAVQTGKLFYVVLTYECLFWLL